MTRETKHFDIIAFLASASIHLKVNGYSCKVCSASIKENRYQTDILNLFLNRGLPSTSGFGSLSLSLCI